MIHSLLFFIQTSYVNLKLVQNLYREAKIFYLDMWYSSGTQIIIKYILKPTGSFYCEIGKSKTCNEIENIFTANNYRISWIFDLNKDPRYFKLECIY